MHKSYLSIWLFYHLLVEIVLRTEPNCTESYTSWDEIYWRLARKCMELCTTKFGHSKPLPNQYLVAINDERNGVTF
jgi:hypothetical protein